LGEVDREDVRKEYIESKTTSPTHPDPEWEKDRNIFFKKPSGSNPAPDRRDSSETVTQDSYDNDAHTYPPTTSRRFRRIK
jgi:hypothetical protein